MTIKEIIEKGLKDIGAAGLRNCWNDCNCQIGDLMGCEAPDIEECLPTYKVKCNKKPSCKDCEYYADKENEWCNGILIAEHTEEELKKGARI